MAINEFECDFVEWQIMLRKLANVVCHFLESSNMDIIKGENARLFLFIRK